jgi:hypothetical protein
LIERFFKRLGPQAAKGRTKLVSNQTPISDRSVTPALQSEFTRDTAFIIMWMDKARPILDDVHNTIKEVCSSFGIIAHRADDVEHQDKITDVILRHIENSDF